MTWLFSNSSISGEYTVATMSGIKNAKQYLKILTEITDYFNTRFDLDKLHPMGKTIGGLGYSL
jgi:hypothetical protein